MLRVILALTVFWLVLGCSWRQTYESRVLEPPPPERVIIPRAVAPEVIAAETRRTQVIAEIARLAWVLRHTPNMETRITLEAAINERRAELERLNAVILPVPVVMP